MLNPISSSNSNQSTPPRPSAPSIFEDPVTLNTQSSGTQNLTRQLEERNRLIQEQERTYNTQQQLIDRLTRTIAQQEETIENQRSAIANLQNENREAEAQIGDMTTRLTAAERELNIIAVRNKRPNQEDLQTRVNAFGRFKISFMSKLYNFRCFLGRNAGLIDSILSLIGLGLSFAFPPSAIPILLGIGAGISLNHWLGITNEQ